MVARQRAKAVSVAVAVGLAAVAVLNARLVLLRLRPISTIWLMSLFWR